MTEHKDMLVPIATQAIAQILRAISPPTTLVHVGWGNGLGELVQWTQWQVPHAYVIEAEESKAAACEAQALALAQTWSQVHNPWQTICATLSAQNAEQAYHMASNPTESGLLPPESLQHAWPHLQTVATQTVTTRSLDDLWQDLSPPLPRAQVKSHTWLIIDCLPAADILSGGAKTLQSAHVVCARSLLADRAKLCDQMRTAGWLEVCWAESQHPAFGHAWFTRDTALELGNATRHHAQLVAERDALAQAKESEIAAKNQALTDRDALVKAKQIETAAKTQALAERDALAQAKGQLQSQLEAFKKAIAESQAQLGITNQAQTDLKSQLSAITQAQARLKIELEEANKRHAQLETERDTLVKAKELETTGKAKALAERDSLAKAKDAETAAKNQVLAERDALSKAKETETASLIKAKTEKDAFAKEKQTLEAMLNESQERLQQLQSANQELQNRQHLQHEDLVKAEAQIEMIKDLLLREQGI